jgi:hypothetical protein
MERGPSVLAVQKKLLWKYLDFMILERNGFFLCGYVPDSVSDKTFVDKVKVSGSKATIVL